MKRGANKVGEGQCACLDLQTWGKNMPVRIHDGQVSTLGLAQNKYQVLAAEEERQLLDDHEQPCQLPNQIYNRRAPLDQTPQASSLSQEPSDLGLHN